MIFNQRTLCEVLYLKSCNEKRLIEMPASEVEISSEVELSFECGLISYPLVSWRKAYKDPTR
jgi:hypothetical protein